MNYPTTAAVADLLAAPSYETAVAVVRASASADDVDRRLAIDTLDAALRGAPDQRDRHVVGTLIALRRAGGPS